MTRLFRNALTALGLLAVILPQDGVAEGGGAVLHARAVAALDGDTIGLEDGRRVRLSGLAAAKALTKSAANDPPPVVLWARRVLHGLVAEQELRLEFEGDVLLDRHGRLLAHAFVVTPPAREAAELWVQEVLLLQGAARVSTTLDTRWRAAEMLSMEAEARGAGRGLWALDFYRPVSAEDAGGRVGSFQIVEGTVLRMTPVGSRVFLNFGEDWRTDFTVALDARARRLLRTAGNEAESLQGRRLRVRGWIRSYNGPFLDVTHPEEIEVLTE